MPPPSSLHPLHLLVHLLLFLLLLLRFAMQINLVQMTSVVPSPCTSQRSLTFLPHFRPSAAVLHPTNLRECPPQSEGAIQGEEGWSGGVGGVLRGSRGVTGPRCSNTVVAHCNGSGFLSNEHVLENKGACLVVVFENLEAWTA